VVLAGGLGSRLGARTAELPKYLVEVAGRPFAFWQLERLRAAGLIDVILCIGHLGDAIRDELGDGSALSLSIRYADEGAARLGTAGALRGALDLLAPTFLLTYGDSYLPFDYAAPLDDLRAHPDAEGTLAVHENRGRFDRSNARLEQERVVAFGKDEGDYDHIDYGAMALRRSVIEALPPGPRDLAELQSALARRGTLRALRVEPRFYEIGSERGLADLEALLAAEQSR
jgi:NDP-sugar pyrophosphorylase family protein